MDSTITKTCKNCKNGTPTLVDNEIICKHKGIVNSEYKCSKYKYDPNAIIKEKVTHYCTECEYFKEYTLAKTPNVIMGTCRLFTNRRYDGSQKKSCSKFKEINLSQIIIK